MSHVGVQLTLAVVGNPNSGKTTLFNAMTGLNQRTGNYPGITTDIFEAVLVSPQGNRVKVIDFPGAYSLYPNTEDELQLVRHLISEPKPRIDHCIYVVDVHHIDSQLLLLTQLQDLGYDCTLVLSHMGDLPPAEQTEVINHLERVMGVRVLSYDAGTTSGAQLKDALLAIDQRRPSVSQPFRALSATDIGALEQIGVAEANMDYLHMLRWHHLEAMSDDQGTKEHREQRLRLQIAETMERFELIAQRIEGLAIHQETPGDVSWTKRVDRVLTHSILGSLIFLGILLLVFQAIYSWSSWPMDQIDACIGWAQTGVRSWLGDTTLADFLADGVLSGIGGVVIFIPQIAILFLLLGVMEISGYMARAVYLFDHIMRRFGMSGRSMVSLMSAGACAIPAVMSARTISSPRERLITILVSPFISCSARIPVYTVLIGLAVPAVSVAGVFNLQGLVFMGLYIASVLVALGAGLVLRRLLNDTTSSPLIIQLPDYQWPAASALLRSVYGRTRSFVVEAGRVIVILSMVLWWLSSYGPSEAMQDAEAAVMAQSKTHGWSSEKTETELASAKMSASYAGHLGHAIEPVIRPLGYDWKIGIGLIAAFAAREVFVGAIATLYSLDGTEEDSPLLRERLRAARHQDTGVPVFTLATAVSLLVFFLLAMQCMSTLAVVRQETRSWRWPALQFGAMLIMAYVGAFVAYQICS